MEPPPTEEAVLELGSETMASDRSAISLSFLSRASAFSSSSILCIAFSVRLLVRESMLSFDDQLALERAVSSPRAVLWLLLALLRPLRRLDRLVLLPVLWPRALFLLLDRTLASISPSLLACCAWARSSCFSLRAVSATLRSASGGRPAAALARCSRSWMYASCCSWNLAFMISVAAFLCACAAIAVVIPFRVARAIVVVVAAVAGGATFCASLPVAVAVALAAVVMALPAAANVFLSRLLFLCFALPSSSSPSHVIGLRARAWPFPRLASEPHRVRHCLSRMADDVCVRKYALGLWLILLRRD